MSVQSELSTAATLAQGQRKVAVVEVVVGGVMLQLDLVKSHEWLELTLALRGQYNKQQKQSPYPRTITASAMTTNRITSLRELLYFRVCRGSNILPSYLVGPEGCGTDMVSGIPSQKAACKKT